MFFTWLIPLPILALGAALWFRARSQVRRAKIALAAAAVITGVLIAAGTGDLALQKAPAQLAMPAGVMFLGAAALTILLWAREQRDLGWLSAGVLGIYMLFGNTCVSTELMNHLEDQIPAPVIAEMPELEAMLVLGGGVGFAENGELRLTDHGDRAILAARMYHAKKVRLLITTASTIPGFAPQQDLSEATRRLWRELMVPEEAIVRVPAPLNTSQEIAAFKELVEQRGWAAGKIGLLSSAYHLPRALALCEKAGLQVVPIGADRRGGEVYVHPGQLIPQAGAFRNSNAALWELLGRLVGR